MIEQMRRILEMIRFSHTLFALPFALLAALLAWDYRARQGAAAWSIKELTGILLCMVTARSASMAFNRLVDRKYDAQNPRTKLRHLPAGLLSVRGVAVFLLVNVIGFCASTLLFWPNRWPTYLAIPVIVFLLGYSFAKRFTSLSHVWLGAALMLAPIAAWIALVGDLQWPPVIIGFGVLLWVTGFDMIYACQDAEVDRQMGLHSIPARWGVARALQFAAICHAAMVAILLLLPIFVPSLGPVYLAGIAAVAALLCYEHWLVKPNDLSRVNLAFFQVNIVVSLGLLAITGLDLWL